MVVDESRNERSDLLKDPKKKTLRDLMFMDENSSVFETEDQQEFFE